MKSKNTTFLRRKPVYSELRKLPSFAAELLPEKIREICARIGIQADESEIQAIGKKAKGCHWIFKYNRAEKKYEGVVCNK